MTCYICKERESSHDCVGCNILLMCNHCYMTNCTINICNDCSKPLCNKCYEELSEKKCESCSNIFCPTCSSNLKQCQDISKIACCGRDCSMCKRHVRFSYACICNPNDYYCNECRKKIFNPDHKFKCNYWCIKCDKCWCRDI